MSLTYNYLASGLEKLKKAALLITISVVLFASIIIIAEAAYIAYIMRLAIKPPSPYSLHPMHEVTMQTTIPPTALAIIIVLVLVLIASSILFLIAIYVKLIPAFSDLSLYKPDSYSTPSTFIKIGYIGFPIVLILAIIAAVIIAASGMIETAAATAVGLIFLAFILLAIGDIGVIIGLFRLKNDTGDSLFQVAAILLLIALILQFVPGIIGAASPILSIISWVLIYVAAKSSLARILSSA